MNKKGSSIIKNILLGVVLLLMLLISGFGLYDMTIDSIEDFDKIGFCHSIHKDNVHIHSQRCREDNCKLYYNETKIVKCGRPTEIDIGQYEFKTEYFPIEQFNEWKINKNDT